MKISELLGQKQRMDTPDFRRRHGDEAAKSVEAHLGMLRNVADKFEADASATATSEDLTSQGKARAGQRLKAEALSTLDQIGAGVTQRRTAANNLTRQALEIATPKRPTDPAERLAYELKAREVRDLVRDLPKEVRTAIHAMADDPEVQDALMTGFTLAKAGPHAIPRIERLVDPEAHAATLRERVRAKNPEHAKNVDRAADLADYLEQTLTMTRESIVRESSERFPVSDDAGGQSKDKPFVKPESFVVS